MNIAVVLVEPKYGGNVGSIARVMKNFGFRDLVIVGNFTPDLETRKMSCHAWDVVQNARYVDKVEDLLNEFDVLVATTGIRTMSEKKFKRISLTPRELPRVLRGRKAAILFGREDYGLYDEELEISHLVVSIPTSEEYAVMNIAQAVAVILYELFIQNYEVPEEKYANAGEVEILFKTFSALLSVIDYPEHKRKNTEMMFRRIVGRASLSKWEFHSLMGILKRTIKKLGGEESLDQRNSED